MARFNAEPEDFPIAEQIKSLKDTELLDFWEETQYLERFLGDDESLSGPLGKDYEELILTELRRRVHLRIKIR